ncbi:MAG: rnhB [Candidatus Taylorbacteria bacterium]|nr:rnhB [Candidatus Taylorbacteria bacterium]
MIDYIIGIDEAGRGPLAGPVSVGICIAPADFDFTIFKNLKDSKKLSEKRRIEVLAQMKELQNTKTINFSVALVSNKMIDDKGIVFAVTSAIKALLNKINIEPHKVKILLDGGLRAPDEYIYQETIIKGDEKEPVISLASIVAKVTRDDHMVKLSKGYPEYGFEIHKGYGTLKHREAIKKHGQSIVHRRTFCGNI